MEGFNGAGAGIANQLPVSRSESLSILFKEFMEADCQLADVRGEVAQLEERLLNARQSLAKTEQYWSEKSHRLAEAMIAAAPQQIANQIQQEQAKYETPAPSTVQGVGMLGTLPRRW